MKAGRLGVFEAKGYDFRRSAPFALETGAAMPGADVEDPQAAQVGWKIDLVEQPVDGITAGREHVLEHFPALVPVNACEEVIGIDVRGERFEPRSSEMKRHETSFFMNGSGKLQGDDTDLG
jgi:hypothetical protein